MRYLLVLLLFLFATSCKRYKDPSPFSDSRINNPYCNIPSALNYNWGFPGVADNSICIYPSTFFSGNYMYQDTLYDFSGNVLSQDSFLINIQALDSTQVNVTGLCGTNVIKAKADRYYKLKFDSTFAFGQHLCNNLDTLTGGGSKKDFSDTLLLKMSYQVKNPAGIEYHAGSATKQ